MSSRCNYVLNTMGLLALKEKIVNFSHQDKPVLASFNWEAFFSRKKVASHVFQQPPTMAAAMLPRSWWRIILLLFASTWILIHSMRTKCRHAADELILPQCDVMWCIERYNAPKNVHKLARTMLNLRQTLNMGFEHVQTSGAMVSTYTYTYF